MSRPTRVLQVITGLQLGGAEIIMKRLLEHASDDFETPVVSLTGRGPLAADIRADCHEVTELEARNPPRPGELRRLAAEIKRHDPDVVQTWLLHANVLAGSAARLQRRRVCWSMHMTEAAKDTHGRATVALQSLEARISSRVPDRIVSCSQSTFELMRRDGYAMSNAEVIPNGFDVDELRPDAAVRTAVREELEIPLTAPLVAHAARMHPMKDHANLLAAAARVLERLPDARFALCGGGVVESEPLLAEWRAKLGDSLLLLGPRNDVTRIWQAADVAVLSSATGEALPLVLGEAMACGAPAVTTDVGDSRLIVGDTGRTVPTRDPASLADALLEILRLPKAEREELGLAARDRVAAEYSLRAMVAGYERVWLELADSSRTA